MDKKRVCTCCGKAPRGQPLYTTGRLECHLWVCLPCVKLCDYGVRCSGCRTLVCYATGSSGDDEIFCDECHSGSTNLVCHACGADIGYHANAKSMQYNEAYCTECIESVGKRKKKQKKQQ